MKQDQTITSSSSQRAFQRKIVRKRSEVSSPISDRSIDSSFHHLKYMRLDKSLSTSQVHQTYSTTNFGSELSIGMSGKINSTVDILAGERVKLSCSTYQSSLLPKKKIIGGEPNDSKEKINVNIAKPLEREKINSSKSISSDLQQTQILSKRLDTKISECRQLENQKTGLAKTIEQLKKRNQTLEEQNKTLKEYVSALNKKISFEQQIVRRVTSLSDVNIQQIFTMQTQREQYLERQLCELREILHSKKGNNEKMLQIQLDSYKRQLYQSNKMIESMKVANNCLQMKMQEKLETSKYNLSQEHIKLKHQNKKLQTQLDTLKKEHKQLKKEHDKILSSKMLLEHSFSLDYSNIAEK